MTSGKPDYPYQLLYKPMFQENIKVRMKVKYLLHYCYDQFSNWTENCFILCDILVVLH